MNKLVKTVFIVSLLIVLGLFSYFLKEQKAEPSLGCENDVDIYFFFSESCTVCARTSVFLDELKERYPELEISRCSISESKSVEKLFEFYAEYGVSRDDYGAVPAIFIPTKYFVGFGSSYASEIESYARFLNESTSTTAAFTSEEPTENMVTIPILGEVDAAKYSLPVLAIILGFFDGFNVCSLGALVMILGLILVLRDRRRIFIFGGAFVLTTAFVYGLLIVLWYNLFVFFAPYLKAMEVLIGVLGVAGGVYFLKDFIRFKKRGPTCELGTSQGLMAKFSSKIQQTLEGRASVIAVVLSVLLFAAVITIAEFPCSAAVPLFFAGILAEAGLPVWQYLSYIALFIIFYMLDEIVIFLIAAATMTIKLASKSFVIWIALVESIVLFVLGLYYLFGFLIFH